MSKGQLCPIRSNEAKVPNPQGLEWAIEAGAFDCSHDGLRESTSRGVNRTLKRGRDVPSHGGANKLCLSVRIRWTPAPEVFACKCGFGLCQVPSGSVHRKAP